MSAFGAYFNDGCKEPMRLALEIHSTQSASISDEVIYVERKYIRRQWKVALQKIKAREHKIMHVNHTWCKVGLLICRQMQNIKLKCKSCVVTKQPISN